MGLFGCSHRRWSRWTKAREGFQQRRCLDCGRVKRRKVSQFWCNHQYGTRIKGRKHAPKVLRCMKCGKQKKVEAKK